MNCSNILDIPTIEDLKIYGVFKGYLWGKNELYFLEDSYWEILEPSLEIIYVVVPNDEWLSEHLKIWPEGW